MRQDRWAAQRRALTLCLAALVAGSGCATVRLVNVVRGQPTPGPRLGFAPSHAFLLRDGSVLLYGEDARRKEPWITSISASELQDRLERGAGRNGRITLAWKRWSRPDEPYRPVPILPTDAPAGAVPSAEDEAYCTFIGAMTKGTRALPVLVPGAPEPVDEPYVLLLRAPIVPDGSDEDSASPQLVLHSIPTAKLDDPPREDLDVVFLAEHRELRPGLLVLLPFSIALDASVLGPALALAIPIVPIAFGVRWLRGDAGEEAIVVDRARREGCRCLTLRYVFAGSVRDCYGPTAP